MAFTWKMDSVMNDSGLPFQRGLQGQPEDTEYFADSGPVLKLWLPPLGVGSVILFAKQ